MARKLFHGQFGLDLLAIMAMIATIAVGEYWAGLVIVLMLAGGQALEEYANRRARAELSALLARVPTIAHHLTLHGSLVDIPLARIVDGDALLVQPGEVVPVDGRLDSGGATTDESQLTGESMPVEHVRGDALLSGSINGADAIHMIATATAATSQYQQIVDLVREASESRPPLVRLADRYALPFTFVALTIATFSAVIAGDPTRFAEVLVVATPCPLLLAAPVAFVAGISRAARAGIVVKGGATLEQLSRVRSAAFDKTGTLTRGTPSVASVEPTPGVVPDELMLLAGSVEQYSSHVLARALVESAAKRQLDLREATNVEEETAAGVRGRVGGHEVAVGKRSYIESQVGPFSAPPLEGGRTAIYVGVDGHYAGCIEFADEVRQNAAATLRALSSLGVRRTAMLTGDLRVTAERIATDLGITDVHAGCLPQDKVRIVAGMHPRPVMMIGDGVNDAPVLAAADIDVAMGARGSTAASESADVVILLDDIMRGAYAVRVGRETTHIALQAIWLGISINIVLMLIASVGVLPALFGAILQEAVDVVTILWALRARLGTFGPSGSSEPLTASAARTSRVLKDTRRE
ncbi:heavy metal translocating P-type ATPase [Mycetocola miduiensis]|uniref:ATPase, P-type (Transporting), HAD superfamily, subfamily IC/heavy metal translocating P-type ATPase n=1 Tax=Mycetocola miduiensis TaxID=995034 RepID=A0A1I5CW34_9MICO|nr:heavy metal translocating P-type ATPase [Mycetocola miduiensis]SFN91159.1 ATPase, P-type (transporting), HAD superfamily, subfamily IC/heavy metal translocating P-type ATPase [Mycetocola miduiensis]